MKTIKAKTLEFEDVSRYYAFEQHETFGKISNTKLIAKTDAWFLSDQYEIWYWKEYNQYTADLDGECSCETQKGNRFVDTLEEAKQMCQDDFNEYVETLLENN